MIKKTLHGVFFMLEVKYTIPITPTSNSEKMATVQPYVLALQKQPQNSPPPKFRKKRKGG
jgi:hypothetical protein